ncbi:probable purine permease 5 [Aristolochia californica]|uniref:probable purine permease 5 n=1 Tax=Aristolochia californica TaxID=171875 RepID=UPI0035E23BDA
MDIELSVQQEAATNGPVSGMPRPQRSLRNLISKIKSKAREIYRSKPLSYQVLLFVSAVSMLVGSSASSLLSRLYFSNGGTSKWIISWVAVAGWPLSAVILLPFYFTRQISPKPLTFKLLLSYIVLGFLTAADNLLFAWAYAYLSASTASLISSSSLIFSSLFGYIIVKNKIFTSTLNAIVVITAAVVIIALDSNSDRYGNISHSQYILGFVLDILGSALHGLIFALSELVFIKLLGKRSFHVVLEQQVAVSFIAFLFTTIGVIIQKDFQAMKSEASRFKHGEGSYYMVIVWGAITFQLGMLGGTAILFLASTMLAGVLNAVRVPLTSIAAVILFHDPINGFKILSLLLTVWGFGSYIYGHSYVRKPTDNVSGIPVSLQDK